MPVRRLGGIAGVDLFVSVQDTLVRRLRSWKNRKPNPVNVDRQEIAITEKELLEVSNPKRAEMLRRIGEIHWYHTITLGHGISTLGEFDHTQYLHNYHLPVRLDGKRVLDVGTCDGFWAFEMEKRGAREVLALDVASREDLDTPVAAREEVRQRIQSQLDRGGFDVAREILGSKATRQALSVYNLSPERVGKFDFVFSGDLLIHLAAPVKALERICSVVNGEALIVESFTPSIPPKTMEYRGGKENWVWWRFSLEALGQMIRDAGFQEVNLLGTFRLGLRGEAASFCEAVFHATNGTPP